MTFLPSKIRPVDKVNLANLALHTKMKHEAFLTIITQDDGGGVHCIA
jgi:hypothetical protein